MSSKIEKLVGDLRAIAEAARRPDGTHCPLSESIGLAAAALEAKDRELALLQDNQADYVELLNMRLDALTAAEARIAEQNARIAELEAEREAELPCDVAIAPVTTINKGCKVSTVLLAIKQREGKEVGPIADRVLDRLRARFVLGGRDHG